ncbi:hypothetical protein D9758_001312 [Tetrapyrgos nigripes]|uniref:RING-type domain-containing protein n=1 Tax=Tetrapyrgos nigripes TaxID=182062 RepID=A0A8H5LU86_9AGAR|nr:hypothetical protein D9758_001312 [Tetrapyrgos nigripes]
MDTELKCNRLTCRKALTDKAVVTTCSHIFCVECANELFNAARLCPACESSLTEPSALCTRQTTTKLSEPFYNPGDLQQSDFVLAIPNTSREVCICALEEWITYCVVASTFQQAVLRNLNDKNAQLQKQLDNVVREANSEISLLNNKNAELERDLEVERRKVRDLQEATREREKEYQKLKAQHDKIKRKALLAPNLGVNDAVNSSNEEPRVAMRPLEGNIGNIGAVAGGMAANGIQRTPIVNRTSFGGFPSQRMVPSGTTGGGNNGGGDGWVPVHGNIQQHHARSTGGTHRQPLPRVPQERRAYRSNGNISDQSDSSNEVENLLTSGNYQNFGVPTATTGWSAAPAPNANAGLQRPRPTAQKVFAPSSTVKRSSGKFRPSVR